MSATRVAPWNKPVPSSVNALPQVKLIDFASMAVGR